MLSDVEEFLFGGGGTGLKSGLKSNFRRDFTKAAVESRRWVKWMTGDEADYSVAQILEDEVLSKQIIEIAGHYTLNDELIKASKREMFENLKKAGLDPHGVLINALMASVGRYVDAFNMEGLTSKLV